MDTRDDVWLDEYIARNLLASEWVGQRLALVERLEELCAAIEQGAAEADRPALMWVSQVRALLPTD